MAYGGGVRLLLPVLAAVLLAGCSAAYDPDDPLTPDYVKRDKYEGLSCSEIGHAYNIEPGLDPEHDRDGDGIACENFRETPDGGFGGGDLF